VLPFIWLILIWCVGGMLSVAPVLSDGEAMQSFGISMYLAMTGVLYACLFSHDTERRLSTMRAAYILAALYAAIFGAAAYFQLFPGHDAFTWAGRTQSTFKGPNAFAPFLVLPMLFLIHSIIVRRAAIRYLIALAIIAVGLILSFSRGGILNFLFSASVMLALLFVTAGTGRIRLRTVAAPLIVALVGGVVLLALLTSDTIADLLAQRASLTQEYDRGETGRFGIQMRSLPMLLDRPNGFGPEQFGVVFYWAPHNAYITAFSSYGWLGGISYVVLVLTTLFVGIRYALMRGPLQHFMIPAAAAFCGLAMEGFVIDTDHWRYFYLISGTIWALAAVIARQRRELLGALPR
jgi:hypothetical protein